MILSLPPPLRAMMLLALNVGAFLSPWVACCLSAQETIAPDNRRLLLYYGDYRRPSGALIHTLLTAGEPGKPDIVCLDMGVVHGSTVSIWKSGSSDWIDGSGKVATTKWFPSVQRCRPYEGRRADLVVAQLELGYVSVKTESERHKIQTETEEAVAGYVAAAKAAGAGLVFYVVPGNQHTTHKAGTKKGDLVKKTEADFQPELKAMDAECRRLSKTYGAVMAPTHLAFAALRTAHPELARPVHGTDTHLWPQDQVLAALVIGRAFLGEGEHPLPTPEVLLAPINKGITTDNIKRKAKGEAEQPLISIDSDIWRAMLEATAAAFAAPTSQKGSP
jgi:hypothetical protein